MKPNFFNHLNNQIQSSITLIIAALYTLVLQIIDTLATVVFYPRLLPYKLLSLLGALFGLPLIWHLDRDSQTDSLIYGSTPLFTAMRILHSAGAEQKKSFIDLGSGRGALVFAARIGWGMAASGVELQTKHLWFSQTYQKLLRLDKILFAQADLLKYPVESGGILFVATTCFPEFMEILLTKKLEKLTMNTVVVTLSSPLKSDQFDLFSTQRLWFSWGRGTVFFQRKK